MTDMQTTALTDSCVFSLVSEYWPQLHVPDTDAHREAVTWVSKWGMAAVTAGVAFWTLQVAGAIKLNLTHTKRFGLLPVTHVEVSRTGDGAASGLEGAILEHLTGKNDHVHEIVSRVIERNSKNPGGALLVKAQADAEQQGYHSWDEGETRGHAVTQALLGNKGAHWQPNATRIVELSERYDTIVQQFGRFLADQGDLATELLHQARTGIDSREESDTDSGPDFND